MNSTATTLSKRKTLKFIGYSSLLSAFPASMVGCNWNQVSLKVIAQRMVSLLFHIEKAQEIGFLYLAADPIPEGQTYQQLTEILLGRLHLAQNLVSKENLEALDQKLKARVHEDFMDEDIVILRGWMLSRTETILCALAAVLNDPQRKP